MLACILLVACSDSSAPPSGKDSMADIIGEAPPPDKVNDGTKDGKPPEGDPTAIPKGR